MSAAAGFGISFGEGSLYNGREPLPFVRAAEFAP